MAWMRTREIKPGVYETQSAGFHAGKQVFIAVGVLIGLILVGMGIAALFSGDQTAINRVIFVLVLAAPLAFWHWSHYRKRPEDRPVSRPGPWDAGDHATTAQEAAFQAESDRLRAEANRRN